MGTHTERYLKQMETHIADLDKQISQFDQEISEKQFVRDGLQAERTELQELLNHTRKAESNG
jgi:peptidoglycan hydrolase CwlO-like protein